jgi:hypothetical protein
VWGHRLAWKGWKPGKKLKKVERLEERLLEMITALSFKNIIIRQPQSVE